MTSPQWIRLEGAANVRDVGGLPAGSSRTRAGRLIRADNLQGLTDADVQELVDRRHVTAVVDLRTTVEVDSEGPGPLVRDGRVRMVHLSLFPEAGATTDVTAEDELAEAPALLPWQAESEDDRPPPRSTAEVYLRYLEDRPDSIVGALRLVARANGATVVHCAAGKDRTGVVVAMALNAVGVDREAVVGDYIRSAERIDEVMDRLAGSPTYAGDVDDGPADRHAPRADTMRDFLAALDERYGGTTQWLRSQGWTAADQDGLTRALLG